MIMDGHVYAGFMRKQVVFNHYVKCSMGCRKGFMGSHEAFAHWLWAWHGWPQWHLQGCHGTVQQLFWTPQKVMAELFGKDHGTWHSSMSGFRAW